MAPADPFLDGYIVRQRLTSETDADYQVVARPDKLDTEVFINSVTVGISYTFDIVALNRIAKKSTSVVVIEVTDSVNVNKITLSSERPRSIDPISNIPNWERDLDLLIRPGTLSMHVKINSFIIPLKLDSQPPASSTVGPFEYDQDVTPGSGLVHLIHIHQFCDGWDIIHI